MSQSEPDSIGDLGREGGAIPARSVLVVGDDPGLLRLLDAPLAQAGYGVQTARSGAAALRMVESQKVDLILLDLELPDIDGMEMIGRLLRIDAPIIAIAARPVEEQTVAALDAGAADCLSRPFGIAELLARARVALRSRKTRAHGARLEIDFAGKRASIDGRGVRLSSKEVALLRLLAAANGEVVDYDKILGELWGDRSDDVMRVRVLAWQVRRKIEPDPTVPRFLIAEAGRGYRLKFD